MANKGIKEKLNKEINPTVFTLIILIIVFFLIFIVTALILSYEGNSYMVKIFGSDVNRVFKELTVMNSGHYRMKVHPLFLLMLQPIIYIADMLIKNKTLTVLIFQSIMGTGSVGLIYYATSKINKSKKISLLISLIYGFSFTTIMFTSVIESFVFAAFFLILFWSYFIIKMKEDKPLDKKDYFILTILGLFSLGITVTNIVQFAIGLFFLILHKEEKRKFVNALLKSIIIGLIIIIISIVLSKVQQSIWKGTPIYINNLLNFATDKSNEEYLYIDCNIDIHRIKEVSSSFFGYNLISPKLGDEYIDHSNDIGFKKYNIIAFVAIMSLLLFIIYRIVKSEKKEKKLIIPLLLAFLFNYALHLIYAPKETFLYTQHFTFLIVFVLGIVSNTKKEKLISIFLAIFLLIQILFNIKGIFDIITIKNTTEDRINKYENQLQELRKEYGTDTYIIRNTKEFFLFGMGDRRKLIYKDGNITDLRTDEIIYSFDIKKNVIIPNEYEVIVTENDNNIVRIYENEDGVWIEQKGKIESIKGTESKLNLPKFEEYKYSEVMKVVLHETLINIENGVPYPNFLAYSSDRIYYRDAMIVAMVLEETDNLELIKDWILQINEPFDMAAEAAEADNLGQVLYLVSLVSDKNHPVVSKVLEEAPNYTKNNEKGKYILGYTDGSGHPVYQTAMLKYGMEKLGIENDYNIPDIEDNYGTLCWWYEGYEFEKLDIDLVVFPYLNWASYHTTGSGKTYLPNRIYPLTWEKNEMVSTTKSSQNLKLVNNGHQITMLHSWASSEMLLLLLEQK